MNTEHVYAPIGLDKMWLCWDDLPPTPGIFMHSSLKGALVGMVWKAKKKNEQWFCRWKCRVLEKDQRRIVRLLPGNTKAAVTKLSTICNHGEQKIIWECILYCTYYNILAYNIQPRGDGQQEQKTTSVLSAKRKSSKSSKQKCCLVRCI